MIERERLTAYTNQFLELGVGSLGLELWVALEAYEDDAGQPAAACTLQL